jgi:hypothetical protein
MAEDQLDRLNRAIEQLFALTRDAANQHNDFAVKWTVEHGSLVAAVARIEERMKMPATCAYPARCDMLETRMSQVEKDSADLKLTRAKVEGGWKSVGVVVGSIGGAVGIASGLAVILQMFKKP